VRDGFKDEMGHAVGRETEITWREKHGRNPRGCSEAIRGGRRPPFMQMQMRDRSNYSFFRAETAGPLFSLDRAARAREHLPP
jgi:hypothetical protein